MSRLTEALEGRIAMVLLAIRARAESGISPPRRQTYENPVAIADGARDAGNWEVAAQHYRDALTLNPENGELWVQYGHALKESGRIALAEASYRRAIDIDPMVADFHLQLGILLKSQGRKGEAEEAFSTALLLDRNLIPSVDDLREFGWTEDRVAELRRNPLPKPPPRRRKPSLITQADRARDLQQWDLAAQLYRKALHRNPLNTPIWVQYGHTLKELGHLQESEAAYRQALVYEPEVADTHLQLGHVMRLRNEPEQARAAYLRAAILDPSLASARTELQRFGWSHQQIEELKRATIEDADPMLEVPGDFRVPGLPQHWDELSDDVSVLRAIIAAQRWDIEGLTAQKDALLGGENAGSGFRAGL